MMRWISMVLVLAGGVGQAAAQTTSQPQPKADPTSAYLQTRPQGTGQQPVTGSLYQVPSVQEKRVKGRVVNKVLESRSLTAVPTEEPRKFAKQDLVTIVIRERSNTTLSSSLETEKEVTLETAVNAFPKIISGQLRPSNGPFPRVDVESQSEFEGEADYQRRDTVDIELQARVIDIKPNGHLVLEAHKFIKNDDEELKVTISGIVRPDDITFDNQVLGTKVAQLRVTKTHDGELRKSTKKGLFTQILEFLINF